MMWVFPLIFLAVVLLFVFRGGCRTMCGVHGRHGREESAREILDRRYARGEISQEEYRRIRSEIEK